MMHGCTDAWLHNLHARASAHTHLRTCETPHLRDSINASMHVMAAMHQCIDAQRRTGAQLQQCKSRKYPKDQKLKGV
jgi:hypothetical protein